MFTSSSPEWGLAVDWSTGQRVPAPARRRAEWTPPPQPGILPKRPMGFFEVLDGGFRLLRRFPSLTYGSAAIGAGLAAGIAAIIGALVWFFGSSYLIAIFEDGEDAIAGFNFAVQLSASIIEYATLAALVFFSGLTSVGAREAFFGRTVALGQAWKKLKGCRMRLLGAALFLGTVHIVLLAMILGASTLLGVLTGPVVGFSVGAFGVFVWWLLTLFFGIRLGLTGCVIAQERTGIFAAMARSWKMTGRGFLLVTGQTLFGFWLANQVVSIIASPILLYLGVIAAVVIALFLAGGTFSGPVAATIGGAGVMALTIAVSALLYAYRASLLTTLYFNQRMRNDGYDLVLLAEAEKA